MKILILSDDFLPDSDIVGGASVATVNLARAMKARGYDVSVISASKERAKCGTIFFEGVTVERIFTPYFEDRWRAYRSLWNPAVTKKIKEIIKTTKPDVVLAGTIHLYLSYFCLLIARRYVKKVYLVAHDIMPFYPGTFTEFIKQKKGCPEVFDYRVTSIMMFRKFKTRFNPFRNFLIRQVVGNVDGIIAVSSALKEALQQNGFKRISVIRNGIDIESWSMISVDAENFVRKFKEKYLSENSKTILFGGRLSGAKGGEVILQAMQRVTATVPGAKLLVAGKKDLYAERMQKRIQEMGISDHVVFTGWLSEEQMREAYLSANVVVTPSVCFDSFPNTNLEAFAAGRPVVATCFGGSREIVANNQNGYIVNPFDISSLATSISTLLLDPEKAAQFGAAGRRLVVEKFSIEKMAEQYIALFSK